MISLDWDNKDDEGVEGGWEKRDEGRRGVERGREEGREGERHAYVP